MSDQTVDHSQLLSLTSQIVSAHSAKNPVSSSDLPNMISSVFGTLAGLNQPEAVAEEPPTPAVPIKKSIQDDHLVCLEDGKKRKMLKRHLSTSYGKTPEDYRAKWGLPYDYPMVAPAYSRTRQDLAKQIGLGRKPAEKPAPTRSRKKKATEPAS